MVGAITRVPARVVAPLMLTEELVVPVVAIVRTEPFWRVRLPLTVMVPEGARVPFTVKLPFVRKTAPVPISVEPVPIVTEGA